MEDNDSVHGEDILMAPEDIRRQDFNRAAAAFRAMADYSTTTETRAVSSTGAEKGRKPERHSLIPAEALDAVARVYAFGAEKYAAHNWRLGHPWSWSMDALLRHVYALGRGEWLDPESGEPHLAHATFHAFAIMTWAATGQLDQNDLYRLEIPK